MTAKEIAFAFFDKHGPMVGRNNEVMEHVRSQGRSCSHNSVNFYRCDWKKSGGLLNKPSSEAMSLYRENKAMSPHDITLGIMDRIENFANADYCDDVALLKAFAELMAGLKHHAEAGIAHSIIQRIERVAKRLKKAA